MPIARTALILRNASKAAHHILSKEGVEEILNLQPKQGKVVVALKETMQLIVAIEQLIFSFTNRVSLTCEVIGAASNVNLSTFVQQLLILFAPEFL